MTQPVPVPRDPPVSDRLHPWIYRTILALAFVFAVSAWGFFRARGQEGLTLAVVSGFVFVAVLIPSVLAHIQRRGGKAAPRRPFGEWAAGRFETLTGAMKSREAVIEILLPITAGALGLLLFAIVLYLDVPSA